MAAKGGIERPANQGNDDDGSGHVAITARVVLSGTSAARRGWDISVRPSSAQIWEIKRSLLLGRRASDYEPDHIIPIGLGGAMLDGCNLQLQRWSGACNAHMKDELESAEIASTTNVRHLEANLYRSRSDLMSAKNDLPAQLRRVIDRLRSSNTFGDDDCSPAEGRQGATQRAGVMHGGWRNPLALAPSIG